MADVNAVVMIGGEIRHVEKKRDFTNKRTGEVRVGKGRRVKVLTFGGFIDVSVGEDFDALDLVEGQVVLWKCAVVPWTIFAEVDPATGQQVRQANKGTAFVYESDFTQQDFAVLTKHDKVSA